MGVAGRTLVQDRLLVKYCKQKKNTQCLLIMTVAVISIAQYLINQSEHAALYNKMYT